MPTTVVTGMRRFLIQGVPPLRLGSAVTRSYFISCSSSVRTPRFWPIGSVHLLVSLAAVRHCGHYTTPLLATSARSTINHHPQPLILVSKDTRRGDLGAR